MPTRRRPARLIPRKRTILTPGHEGILRARLTFPATPAYRGGPFEPRPEGGRPGHSVISQGRAHCVAPNRLLVLVAHRGARSRTDRIVTCVGGDRAALVRHARARRGGGPAVDRHQLPAHPVLRDQVHARRHPARSLDGRMSVEVAGKSATGRDMYKVVINQLRTGAQKQAFFRWTNLRAQGADRAGVGAGAACLLRGRHQGPALHPGRHPRQRVRGRRLEHAHRSSGSRRPRTAPTPRWTRSSTAPSSSST